MITSHGYPQSAANHGYVHSTASSENTEADIKSLDGEMSHRENMSSQDPFSPNFSEDDLDIAPINLPPSALEDQQHTNQH